jgi:hypothetical protein
MIIMGGNAKLRAGIFALTGVLFLVLAFTMGSFTRTLFLIIGIADLAIAGFTYWAGHKAESQASGPDQPGNWVG